MALDMTPEQKAIGQANFHRAVGKLAEADRQGGQGVTRRRFMQGLIGAGATLPVAAAAYFGYSSERVSGHAIKAGLIGAGDEGGVLVGEHNPHFVEFIAYSDIRPSNQRRIFEGELATNPRSPRKGFNRLYGPERARRIQLYQDYRQLLENSEIEMVVIALPLHLHAPVAIEALRAGKHVLCEKLMAWNIRQCKDMIRAADEADRLLAIGHQRHYSLLYAHALEVKNSGILGEVRHIRALWHRNNARPKLENGREVTDPETGRTRLIDGWRPDIKPEDRAALEGRIRQLGYRNMSELVRWRLYNRTGGGLMAELGSHQLDACSIFLGKVRPLAVSGVGGRYLYRDDREIDDHVFCTFEFPGPNYWANEQHTQVRDRDDVVVVTYSSINTNSFEKYGECVMGSKGTLVIEEEQNAMLWGPAGRSTEVTVATAGGGRPVLDSSASGEPVERRAAATGEAALGFEPISRGYKEEMEHFAYLIRNRHQGMARDRENLRPRCDGRAAMADAIMALTANQAMKHKRRIEFLPTWYDPALRDRDPRHVPDPDMRVLDLQGNPTDA
jgi:predicted dehydrogenase